MADDQPRFSVVATGSKGQLLCSSWEKSVSSSWLIGGQALWACHLQSQFSPG